MRKLFKKRWFKCSVIAAAVIILLIIIISSIFGAKEIAFFNAKSIMNWKLGESVEGISSPEDGEKVDYSAFTWFNDGETMGLWNAQTGTRYFMSDYPSDKLGKFCVTGFVTNERVYSVMGISVGDDEVATKNKLLDYGFDYSGGGHNSCRAEKGSIAMELEFWHGSVIQIYVYIK